MFAMVIGIVIIIQYFDLRGIEIYICTGMAFCSGISFYWMCGERNIAEAVYRIKSATLCSWAITALKDKARIEGWEFTTIKFNENDK